MGYQNVIIDAYTKNETIVKLLQELIENDFIELFKVVLVHGSVGTDEIIKYSDFDGLLIVKDNFIASKQLHDFKNKSMKLILKFDPLQHHGWFQIKESDLSNYPESYLPISTLERSKLIYPREDKIELSYKVANTVDYKSSLVGMLNQFENRIQHNWKPSNIFELKSVLSQVMLLPCLYYSAINNKGIFKRESFNAVESSFTREEWEPIIIATQLRRDWNNELNVFQSV